MESVKCQTENNRKYPESDVYLGLYITGIHLRVQTVPFMIPPSSRRQAARLPPVGRLLQRGFNLVMQEAS